MRDSMALSTRAFVVILLLTSSVLMTDARLRGPKKRRRTMQAAPLYEKPDSLIPVEDDEEPELPYIKIRSRTLQELPQLTGLGGNPGTEVMPLGLCEGDCDDDSDVSTTEVQY